MPLWGNTKSQALTGNVSIASGNTTLSGLTGATFLTQLRIGDFIIASGQNFKITALASANSATVTPAAGAAITNQAAVISKDPKWLSGEEASTVTLVTIAEAQNANNKANGIVTPGWTKFETYGSGRRRVETLVAFKGQ